MRRSALLIVAGIGAFALGLAGATTATASGPPSDNPNLGPLTTISPNHYQEVTIGDLDDDGDNDIVGVSGLFDTFQYFFNDGNASPTFTPSAVFSLPVTCGDPIFDPPHILDFIAGGDLEVVIFCNDQGANKFISFYDSAGALLGSYSNSNLGSNLAVTTFDGLEAVAAPELDGDLTYLTNDGALTATTIALTGPADLAQWWGTTIAFDYLGVPTVAVGLEADSGDGYWLVQDGVGTTGPFLPTTVASWWPSAVGDFDANGLDDLATNVAGQGWKPYFQQGDGSFVAGPHFASAAAVVYFDTAQYSGQCYPDIWSYIGWGATLQPTSNQGNYSFANSGTSFAMISDGRNPAVGDLNGDGRPDWVVPRSVSLDVNNGLQISIQNDGSPFVTTQPVSVSGGGPGQPVEFSVETDIDVFVQWQRAAAGTEAWTNIPGADNLTLSVTPTAADNGARYRALVWTDDPESQLYLPMLSCPATLSLILPATGNSVSPVLQFSGLGLLLIGFLIAVTARNARKRPA